MHYYKILKHKAGFDEAMTDWEKIFTHYIADTDKHVIFGALPLTFNADGGAIHWTIYGNNTQHNYSAEGTLPLTFSTHTAGAASDWVIEGNNDNGTEQLFDKSSIYYYQGTTLSDGNVWKYYEGQGKTFRLAIQSGQYTVSIGDVVSDIFRVCAINSDDVPSAQNPEVRGTSLVFRTGISEATFTVPNDAKYIVIQFSSTAYDAAVDAMVLTAGRTAPDHYIPYQQGVGERTKNLVVGYLSRRNINASGTIIQANNYSLHIAPIRAGVTYSFRTDPVGADVYAFFANYPANNMTSYDGQRTVDDSTFTAPIDGYVAVRSNVANGSLSKVTIIEGAEPPTDFIPLGYEIPLNVNNTTQSIYIGASPLTEGETVSKTSTGVDIAAIAGSNTITTDLYNKPSMSLEGVDYVGVGEYVDGQWQIPLTVSHYTDNIFDKDAKNTNKGYEDSACIMWAGNIPYPYMTGNEDNNYFVSEKIPASPNTTYYFSDGIFKNTDNGIYSVFLWNRYRMSDYQAFPTEKTFITGDDTRFIQVCVLKTYADTVMITTKPTETYIPHKQSTDYTIPIDAPLTEGQSVTDTVEITAYEGINTLDTTLANKPNAEITYEHRDSK